MLLLGADVSLVAWRDSFVGAKCRKYSRNNEDLSLRIDARSRKPHSTTKARADLEV
jgi:hypothetical protein